MRRLNTLLVIIWLAMLGGLVLIYLSPPRLGDYLASSEDTDPAPLQIDTLQNFDSLQVPALAQYAETVDRPLFYPERRQPEPEPPEPAAAPEPPPPPEPDAEMTLIGVLITPASTTAMVKVENAEKTDLLKIGDKVESWQLAEIKTESVLLRKGQQTKELLLERNQRGPSMTPHSLRQPAAEPPAPQQATTSAPGGGDHQQTESQQVDQEMSQEVADERLRLRQERLKAIAERRRQLLEQQRARAEAAKAARSNNRDQ